MPNKEVYITRPAKVVPHFLRDDGIFPNSMLPLLVYRKAFVLPEGSHPRVMEKIFEANNWTNAWHDGIFKYHHYHSITHEVLGVYSGKCRVLMGGDDGIAFEIEKGDVLVIPAGVAHKNISNSEDFKCIGAYPGGHDFDMNYGKAGERPATDHNISNVPLPPTDPIYSKEGPLFEHWVKHIQ